MSSADAVRPPVAAPVRADAVPRARPWAAVAVLALVLSLVAFAFAGATLYARAFSTLPTYPAHARGTVTGLSFEHYTDPRYDPCGPRYDFTVDGRTVAGSSPNVDEAYCAFEVGDGIDVTYDPSNPAELNAPAAHYTSGAVWTVASTTTGVVLLALSIASALLAGRRRRTVRTGLSI